MEKRFLLALVLSLAVLLGWQFLFPGPKPAPKPVTPPVSEAPKPVESTTPAPAPAKAAVVPVAERREEVLENDDLRLVVSNDGAVLTRVELKGRHPSVDSEHDLLLVTSEAADKHAALELRATKNDDLGSGHMWQLAKSADGRTLVMERSVERPGGRLLVRKELSLPAGHSLHAEWRCSVRAEGEANAVFPLDLALQVTPGVFQEPGASAATPAHAGLNGVEREYRSVMAAEVHEESGGKALALAGAQRFAGDFSNYFGMLLLLESFPDSVVARVSEVAPKDRKDEGASDLPRTATCIEFGMRAEAGAAPVTHSGLLYMGPVDDRIVAADLADKPAAAEALALIYRDQLGWARVIGRAVLFLLDLMHGLCGNWGVAIILMTLLVRCVLFPVNRRSQDAMAKHQEQMAKLKPKLEALKKKHEGDSRKFAEEQMKLMREEKVKLVPLGGCLPMLLQIPIFFGLFSALRASIDLRQAGWWWVSDLSQPDHLITFASPVDNPMSLCGFIPGCGSCVGGAPALTGLHLLPILMTIAWFLNSWLMPKPATSDPQMEQQRKMMLFMPVLFGFMMYSYAAGLSLYWLVSSSIGIVEGRIIRSLRARQG